MPATAAAGVGAGAQGWGWLLVFSRWRLTFIRDIIDRPLIPTRMHTAVTAVVLRAAIAARVAAYDSE